MTTILTQGGLDKTQIIIRLKYGINLFKAKITHQPLAMSGTAVLLLASGGKKDKIRRGWSSAIDATQTTSKIETVEGDHLTLLTERHSLDQISACISHDLAANGNA
jgi:hypothetical protein